MEEHSAVKNALYSILYFWVTGIDVQAVSQN